MTLRRIQEVVVTRGKVGEPNPPSKIKVAMGVTRKRRRTKEKIQRFFDTG